MPHRLNEFTEADISEWVSRAEQVYKYPEEPRRGQRQRRVGLSLT